MHGIFVAHGPFAQVAKVNSARRRSPLSWITSRAMKGWHPKSSDDAYIMETFQNVEIYNLVMRLLGIEEHAAPTNGTRGFWDIYIDPSI